MLTLRKSELRKLLDIEVVAVGLFALLLFVRLSGDFLPINIYVAFMGVIGVIGLRYAVKFPPISRDISLPYLTVIGFLLLAVVMLFFTRTPGYGGRKVFLFVPFISLALLCGGSVIRHMKIFQGLFVFLALFTVVLFYINDPSIIIATVLESEVGGRLELTENTNAIVVGTLFATTIILLLPYEIPKPSGKNFFLNAVIFLLSFGLIAWFIALLFLTGSRGVMLGVIMAILIYYLFNRRNIYLAFLRIGLAGGVIWGLASIINLKKAVFAIFPAKYHMFIDRRFFNEDAGESLYIRLRKYETALNGFLEAPPLAKLFGSGMGDYAFLANGYDTRDYPHNIFLEVLYEMGIVGLILTVITVAFPFAMQRMYVARGLSVDQYRLLFLLFYFFLFRAQSTGDIAGNFWIFLFAVLLAKADQLNNNGKLSLAITTK